MLLLLPFSCAGKTTRIPIFGASPTARGIINLPDNGVMQVPKLLCKRQRPQRFSMSEIGVLFYLWQTTARNMILTPLEMLASLTLHGASN